MEGQYYSSSIPTEASEAGQTKDMHATASVLVSGLSLKSILILTT